ncbi:MAG: hypothetical protein PHE02_14635 [Lachnospiraceae bacterium]|nr:hypothetical protein [Lachnospiraceae bacterium]
MEPNMRKGTARLMISGTVAIVTAVIGLFSGIQINKSVNDSIVHSIVNESGAITVNAGEDMTTVVTTLLDRYENVSNEKDKLTAENLKLVTEQENLKKELETYKNATKQEKSESGDAQTVKVEEPKTAKKNLKDLMYKQTDFTYTSGIKINNNAYTGFEIHNRGAYALINLEKNYTNLAFDFGPMDEACDTEQVGNIHIFLDGMESGICTVKGDDMIKHFEIDVTDVEQLKLELHCDKGSMWADGFGMVNVEIQ